MVSINKSMERYFKAEKNEERLTDIFKKEFYFQLNKNGFKKYNNYGNSYNCIGWESEKSKRIMMVTNLGSKYKNEFFGDLIKINEIESKYNNYEMIHLYVEFKTKLFDVLKIYSAWFEEKIKYDEMLSKLKEISNGYKRMLINHIRDDFNKFIKESNLVEKLNWKENESFSNGSELGLFMNDEHIGIYVNENLKRAMQINYRKYTENKKDIVYANYNTENKWANFVGYKYKMILSIDSIQYKDLLKNIISKWFDESIEIKEIRSYIEFENRKIEKKYKNRRNTIKTKNEKKYLKRRTC